MKTADFETHTPAVNTPLADSVQLLQAEIDQILDVKVGSHLIARVILGMIVMASLQWALSLPSFVMLAMTFLYLAGVFAFSFLKLRRALRKGERLRQVQLGG